MAYPDPSAVVAAIQAGGASYHAGYIKNADVDYECLLTNDVWSVIVADGSGKRLRSPWHYNKMLAGTVGEDFLITSDGVQYKLVIQENRATLLAPEEDP